MAPGAPLSVIFCAADEFALWNICAKVRPLAGAGVAEMVPAVTLNVTVITCGLPVAFGEVTVTVPVYVPTGSFEPSTEIVRFAGVAPPVGVTVNQLTPAVPPLAAAVKLRDCPAPDTATVWAAGA